MAYSFTPNQWQIKINLQSELQCNLNSCLQWKFEIHIMKFWIIWDEAGVKKQKSLHLAMSQT
jgi:hypothetical protein